MEKAGMAYTADDIVERYLNEEKDGGFLSFIRKHITHLGRTGCVSAAEKITHIYLASLDTSAVDNANNLILRSL